ncbi:MAG: branched-chain amino acid ABC transporter permease [Pseudomonadota bacterium]
MSHDLSFWSAQILHGLQFSMLLFLLSIGLSIIFGLLHFVNLAHGSFYALGAYCCFSITLWSGSFGLGVLITPFIVAFIGLLLYLVLIRHMQQTSPMEQVLVTFGLIFVALDLTRMIWGDIALGVDPPDFLKGSFNFLFIEYSSYRLLIIITGLLVMAVLYLILRYTKAGIIIRACVDNRDMAACLGLDVKKNFIIVFCIGCALAGLAGAIALPVFSATTDMGISILIPSFIVVVIGGLGSLKGAVLGSLLVGFIETFGAILAPQFASLLIYILLAMVLVFLPKGFFPVRD